MHNPTSNIEMFGSFSTSFVKCIFLFLGDIQIPAFFGHFMHCRVKYSIYMNSFNFIRHDLFLKKKRTHGAIKFSPWQGSGKDQTHHVIKLLCLTPSYIYNFSINLFTCFNGILWMQQQLH